MAKKIVVGFKGIAKRLRARAVASRRTHLNRSTGRRVHRAKAEAEHLERQD